MKKLGILIFILGIVMTTLTGFNIVTKKKVAEIGSVEITREKETPIYWSPMTGGALAAVGIVLLLVGNKRNVR